MPKGKRNHADGSPKHQRHSDPSATDDQQVALLRAELERISFQNAELSRQHVYYQHYLTQTQQQLMQQHQSQATSPLVQYQYPYAPRNFNPNRHTIFLGGSLGSDDWQKHAVQRMENLAVCVLNPRAEKRTSRSVAAEHGGNAENTREENVLREQTPIVWEARHLLCCNCFLFWFPWDHPNVTTSLLELGSVLGRLDGRRSIALFVGVHPKNKDKKCIYEFVRTTTLSAYIGSNLDRVIDKLISWIQTGIMPANSQSSSSEDCF